MWWVTSMPNNSREPGVLTSRSDRKIFTFPIKFVSLAHISYHPWHGKECQSKASDTQSCCSRHCAGRKEMTNPNKPSRAISWQNNRQRATIISPGDLYTNLQSTLWGCKLGKGVCHSWEWQSLSLFTREWMHSTVLKAGKMCFTAGTVCGIVQPSQISCWQIHHNNHSHKSKLQ